MLDENTPTPGEHDTAKSPPKKKTGTALLVPPPLPSELSPRGLSLAAVMDDAFVKVYKSDDLFLRCIEPIQSETSFSGTTRDDNMFALMRLVAWCSNMGEQYLPLVDLMHNDMPRLKKLFHSARVAHGVDVASRRKAALKAVEGSTH